MKYQFLGRGIEIDDQVLEMAAGETPDTVHYNKRRFQAIAFAVAASIATECPICKSKFNGRLPAGNRGRRLESVVISANRVRHIPSTVAKVYTEELANPITSGDMVTFIPPSPIHPDILVANCTCSSCGELFTIHQMDTFEGFGVEKYSVVTENYDLPELIRNYPYKKASSNLKTILETAVTPYGAYDLSCQELIDDVYGPLCERLKVGAALADLNIARRREALNTVVLTPETVKRLVPIPIQATGVPSYSWDKYKMLPVWAETLDGSLVIGLIRLGKPVVEVGGVKLTDEIPKSMPFSIGTPDSGINYFNSQLIGRNIEQGTMHKFGGIAAVAASGTVFGASVAKIYRRGFINTGLTKFLDHKAFLLHKQTLLNRMFCGNIKGKEDWLSLEFMTGDPSFQSYFSEKLNKSNLLQFNSYFLGYASSTLYKTKADAIIATLSVHYGIPFTYGPQDEFEEALKNEEISNDIYQAALG